MCILHPAVLGKDNLGQEIKEHVSFLNAWRNWALHNTSLKYENQAAPVHNGHICHKKDCDERLTYDGIAIEQSL